MNKTKMEKFKEARDAGLNFCPAMRVSRGEISLEEALGDMDMDMESSAAVPVGNHQLLTGIDLSGKEYTGVAICFHDGKEWKPLPLVTQADMDALFNDDDDEKCFCGSGDNYLDCGCIPF